MLKVITYNIHYGKRLDEVLEWIKNQDVKPDVICFQEFPEDEVESLKNKRIFRSFDYYFIKGLSRRGKLYGELTIINKSKVESKKIKALQFGTDKKKRILRSALINVFKKDGKEFAIVNLHFSPFSLNSTKRKNLKTVIENLKHKHAIILGDFNYSNLLRKKTLIEFMTSFNYNLAGDKMITNKYKKLIPQQLDYVFVKKLEIEKIEVMDVKFSDHFPIYFEVEF